ncbi:MAG TPA: hypothetical protein VNU94_04745 [Acidobacteriaceae bacterium]|jgi:hypothetical protein|nr:hypothetical protein [Acidobacteriaceae bacterium]
MHATKLPPMNPRRRRYSSTFLLLCAGLAVVAGNYCGSGEWGNCIPAGLGFVLAAIVLSMIAIARSGQEQSAGEASTDAPDQADGIQSGPRRRWLIFGAAILIHGAVALYLCKAVPAITMDCFTFQRDAANKLVHGIDPYGTTQVNVYSPVDAKRFYGPGMVANGRVLVGLQYPPLTLLWILPGYLLGDVRYSYVLAIMIAAWLSFAMVPNKRSQWLTVFLLLNPLTFYVENRCFTEPLVLMMLCATVYAAVKKRWWLPLALGLLLAAKQYNFLVLPLAGYLVQPFQWRRYLKLAGTSLVVAAATVLPFACWNLRGLWHDLVLFHLAQPFRADAMSFAVAFPLLLKIGPLLLLAFLVWSLRVSARSAAMFAAAYGVSVLLFFSTSKQAFCNYYFLIAQALLLAVAAWPEAKTNDGDRMGDGFPEHREEGR